MLNNVGGYQVDKAKFALELLPQDLGEWKSEFALAVANSVGPQGGRTYNIASLKKGATQGTFLYVFDVWGDAAQDIDGLDFKRWYPHLQRLDLKVAMPMTADGQRNYYDYARPLLSGKRNIDLRESPIRQKRGDRDAGGYTLAIGSHKSDFRAHWTLRGRESGYQEFQLEGSRLLDAIGVTNYRLRNPGTDDARCTWLGFCKAVLVGAQVELTDLDGLYDSDRAGILAGYMNVHGVVERKLERIEHDIGLLPRDALFSLLDALNEKVFGLPPEADADVSDLGTADAASWEV